MRNSTKYYIAYGSNLNLEQMSWRCPDAVLIGTSEIKDYELLFRGSKSGCYLTIEPCLGASVPVGIFQVSADDEKALDRYEGFPNFYYKKTFEGLFVTKEDRNQICVDAFAYIMHEDRPLGLPSLAYMDTCLEGYYDFGFDLRVLWEARRRTQLKLGGKIRYIDGHPFILSE